MTQEEEIAALRAELARERSRADGLQEIVHALAVRRRSSGAERQARYRERHGDVTSDASRDVTPSPPPLDGSPPPSIPSSPSPLSSPPSFLPPSPAPEDFRLEPRPTRRAKKPKTEKPTDPRHAPLVAELVAVCQELTGRPYRFSGGHDARAVAELLASADQDEMTRGETAPAEVVRRWRIGLSWRWWNGEAPVQDLPSLNRRWQNCASTETAPPAQNGRPREDPNSGILQAAPDACTGCGSRGHGGSVGEPHVWLGYQCGCLPAFVEAQSQGLHYTKAAEWAERRKREHEGDTRGAGLAGEQPNG